MVDGSHHLEGLERLARERGVDTRATVLRVATDLFAAAYNRTPADIERYTALALPLINVADHATKVMVARRLAPVADAPDAVVERLLSDDVEVARELVLLRPALNRDSMLGIALEGGIVEASALAERKDLDRGTTRGLSSHPSREVLETLIANPAVPLDGMTLSNIIERVRQDAPLANALLRRPDVDATMCARLYPVLGAEERGMVRAALARAGQRPAAPLDPDALHTFRLAVLRGGTEGFVKALADLLRVPATAAAVLVDDPTGELPALALIASGCDREATIAALLICAPERVRTSIPLIFSAAALYDDTPRSVALAIVRAVLGASTRPVHQPLLDPAEPPQRASQEGRKAGSVTVKVKGMRFTPKKSG
ncbi:hypothetical protein GCM10007276_13000 [Agaricicola taiwanensis]|uniref:DUF2336 domain-containing protein n=1 Tax=Agaricicola taiwanensis TaxID=591372 RepID=A0A8J2YGP7_9RHOB|nr:DUF2336 domain-containing protein [Agaricicola taiwanensis]GGE36927.1 hypothetical protein GCM10007276_13000 [Agaricicola taiwanensis]